MFIEMEIKIEREIGIARESSAPSVRVGPLVLKGLCPQRAMGAIKSTPSVIDSAQM